MSALPEKQTLQNFTDLLSLEHNDATNAIANFLHASPQKKDELINFLLNELNKGYSITDDSIFSDERKILKASKSSQKILALLKYLLNGKFKSIKKQVAEINRDRIIQAIHNAVVYCGIIPTVLQIARETGLSRQTVNTHFNQLRSNGYFEKQKVEKEILLDKALLRLYKIGMTDNNVNALKTFVKLNKCTHQTNYIQVNNLVITQEQLQQLPPEKFTQIQEILSTNTNG